MIARPNYGKSDMILYPLYLVMNVHFPLIHSYGLFASVSTILKTNMGKYLKDIVKYMIDSLQSTEGIVVRNTLCG